MKVALALISISTLFLSTSFGQSNISKNPSKAKTNKTEVAVETTTFTCDEFKFRSAQEQADSLFAFMQRALDTNSANTKIWEQKFFCAFPNSFKNMEEILDTMMKKEHRLFTLLKVTLFVTRTNHS